VVTQYLRGKLACELTEDLGRLNEYMGSIRPVVRAAVPTEAQRRQVYRSILQELLEKGETKLPQERLQELLTHYNAI
jgi:siroheme synthase (precorrin-2 oxidase/ferrochelatase)